MAFIVSKHIEGHYEIEVRGPEDLWLEILCGRLLCDDVSVLSIAVERGLLDLMFMFGRPERCET